MYTGGEEETGKIICMGLAGDSCYETGDYTRVGSCLSVCPHSARSGHSYTGRHYSKLRFLCIRFGPITERSALQQIFVTLLFDPEAFTSEN